MSKRGLAIWPLWLQRPEEEAIAASPVQISIHGYEWSQEEELHKLQLLRERESSQERLLRVGSGLELKRLLS